MIGSFHINTIEDVSDFLNPIRGQLKGLLEGSPRLRGVHPAVHSGPVTSGWLGRLCPFLVFFL